MPRLKLFKIITSGLIILVALWFCAPLINQISISSFALLDFLLILFSGSAFALFGWISPKERLEKASVMISTSYRHGLEICWFGFLSLFLLADALFEPFGIGWLFAMLKLAPAVRALLAFSIILKLSKIWEERESDWGNILKSGLWLSLGLLLICFGDIQVHLSAQIYPVMEFITFSQAILILFVGGMAAWMIERKPLSGWAEVVLFMFIWALAAGVWVSAPLGNLPLGEGGIFIPAEDARVYDASASLIIQGHGSSLRSGSWANYAGLLAGFKFLLGTDPLSSMRAQAALLGSIPALLYLLGKELGSRSMGLYAAVLFITSNFNLLVSSKSSLHISTLQTEPFMTLGIVLMVLLFIKALKNPESRLQLILFGGFVGFFSLVRINSLLFLFAPLLTFFQRKQFSWSKAAWAMVALGAGFILIISPSIFRNASLGYEPMYFSGKVKDLAHRMGFERWNPNELLEGQFESWDEPDPHDYQFSWQVVGERAFSIATYDLNFLPRLINDPSLRPNSNLAEHPFLRITGFEINAFNSFTFLLNLLLVGLGISRFVRLAGWAGLAPVIFYLAYFLTAVFSSSLIPRHVFPIAWVPLLYYPAGIWKLTETVRGSKIRQFEIQPGMFHPRLALIGLIGILAASLAIPLMEQLIPTQQTFKLKADTDSQLNLPSQAILMLEKAGIQPGEVSSFLVREPTAALSYGRIFYPAGSDQATFGEVDEMTFAFYDTRLYPEVVIRTQIPLSELKHAEMILMLYCEGRDAENLTKVAFITNGSATVQSSDFDFLRNNCP